MSISQTASSCLKSGLISLFITNLGKYNEGELIGQWIDLPIAQEELSEVLKQIKIDNINYEEYFFSDYESSIEGLSSYITEYSHLDTLNRLTECLESLSDEELNLFEAALELGENTSSIQTLIELTDNLDEYQLLTDVHNDYDLGYYWIEESGCYDLNSLGSLSHCFDYEQFGRDIHLDLGGTYCSDGYVYILR